MFAVVNSSRVDRKTAKPLPSEKVGRKAEPEKRFHINPIWQKLASHIQPKLAVSTPDDPYEQEADRVAERVLRMPEPVIQRAGALGAVSGSPCPKCEEEPKLMRTPAGAGESSAVTDDVTDALGSGRPLE